MPIPVPDPIYIDVIGAKILGVKNYRVNIFDAWKDKGVVLKQPLAKFQPPADIKSLVDVGIASSLAKKEEEIRNELKTTDESVVLKELLNRVKATSPHAQNIANAPFMGGAMFDWGSIFGGAGNAISSGLGDVGSTISGWFNQAGQSIAKVGGDIGKVWNALVNLSDLVNQMSQFLKDWKSSSEVLTNKILDLNVSTKALSNMANQLILENRKLYADLMTKMDASLAKYFDDLSFNLLKYGQVTVPTAVVGAITIKSRNSSAVPVSITVPDLTIKSGPYVLHKGTYVLNMMPFETDTGDVPFNITGVDESKYVLERKTKYGTLPLEITGTMITPFGKKNLHITKTVKI